VRLQTSESQAHEPISLLLQLTIGPGAGAPGALADEAFADKEGGQASGPGRWPDPGKRWRGEKRERMKKGKRDGGVRG